MNDLEVSHTHEILGFIPFIFLPVLTIGARSGTGISQISVVKWYSVIYGDLFQESSKLLGEKICFDFAQKGGMTCCRLVDYKVHFYICV